MAAAVQYARKQLPHSKTILYGGSMGAAAVLRAVAMLPMCNQMPSSRKLYLTKCLIRYDTVLRPWASPPSPAPELLVFWGGLTVWIQRFCPQPGRVRLAAVRCPILFLHGSADPRAHLEEARRVFAAVTAPKQFKEFPNLGHEPSVVRFPTEWKATVSQFLQAAANKTLP